MMPIVANMQVASFPEAIMCSYGLTLMMVGKKFIFLACALPSQNEQLSAKLYGTYLKNESFVGDYDHDTD